MTMAFDKIGNDASDNDVNGSETGADPVKLSQYVYRTGRNLDRDLGTGSTAAAFQSDNLTSISGSKLITCGFADMGCNGPRLPVHPFYPGSNYHRLSRWVCDRLLLVLHMWVCGYSPGSARSNLSILHGLSSAGYTVNHCGRNRAVRNVLL